MAWPITGIRPLEQTRAGRLMQDRAYVREVAGRAQEFLKEALRATLWGFSVGLVTTRLTAQLRPIVRMLTRVGVGYVGSRISARPAFFGGGYGLGIATGRKLWPNQLGLLGRPLPVAGVQNVRQPNATYTWFPTSMSQQRANLRYLYGAGETAVRWVFGW